MPDKQLHKEKPSKSLLCREDSKLQDLSNTRRCRKIHGHLGDSQLQVGVCSDPRRCCGYPLSQQHVAGMQPIDPPSSLPGEHGGDTFTNNTLLTNSHSVGGRRRAKTWRRPSLRRKAITQPSVAVFAVILIALALTSLCMRLRTKLRGAEVSGRRLAGSEKGGGSEDDELGGILEQCLDMEQEYQMTSGSTTVTDSSVVSASQPVLFTPGQTASMADPIHGASKTAPSPSMEAAAEGEGTAPLLVSFNLPTGVHSESGSLTPSLDSLAPEAWLESIPPIPVGEPASPGEASMVAEAAADEKRGALQTAVSHPSKSAAAAYKYLAPLAAGSDWSPRASAGGRSFTSSSDPLSPEARLDYTPHSAAGEMGREGEATVTEQSPHEDEQPSTSASAEILARIAWRADEGPGIFQHPFIRRPVLVPGCEVRAIDPDSTTKASFLPHSSRQLLAVVRRLFAQRKLGANHIDLLVNTIESLVRFARSLAGKEAAPPRNAHKVRHVGLYFLIVDAVVAALELLNLEATSQSWWSSFTASFPTHMTARQPVKGAKEIQHFNYKLLKGLLSALEIYKSGRRPDVRQVLQLKRMLLCSSYSVAYFKAFRWDPWRQDDKAFHPTPLESSDRSEDEDESD